MAKRLSRRIRMTERQAKVVHWLLIDYAGAVRCTVNEDDDDIADLIKKMEGKRWRRASR